MKKINKFFAWLLVFALLLSNMPSNIIAKMFSFKRKELFKIDEEKRNNVKVNFND